MDSPRARRELRAARYQTRWVKDELRHNLIRKLRSGEKLFPGIVGYDETVVPQLINGILARHNIILLGLRGQAKSRIIRLLTELLDERIPIIAGSEVNDDPFRPISAYGRQMLSEHADSTLLDWIGRDARFVEKLATPDVTVADIVGDVDPIKAAKGGHLLSDELTIHYGLLPRANRGIFAINELPDLAGKIQVALFNIMQEGDVQIKGYPVRLNLDVALVFSANPEDYTARGKIVTPLKDRIGSEVRTHYAGTLEEGVAITQQEAWAERNGHPLYVPQFIREIVEQIAFAAREDKRVDKRSGVSQRLPISTMENVISNAERRALRNRESTVVPRVGDIYGAIPSITGKLELEYEGELRGADSVVRDLIRLAVARTFDSYFKDGNMQQITQWFDLGGQLKFSDTAPSSELLDGLKHIQGLTDKLAAVGVKAKDKPEVVVSAAEFLLEGLYAHKRIGRSEERVFTAPEKQRHVEKAPGREEVPQPPRRADN